jgi:hypothetical protein
MLHFLCILYTSSHEIALTCHHVLYIPLANFVVIIYGHIIHSILLNLRSYFIHVQKFSSVYNVNRLAFHTLVFYIWFEIYNCRPEFSLKVMNIVFIVWKVEIRKYVCCSRYLFLTAVQSMS